MRIAFVTISLSLIAACSRAPAGPSLALARQAFADDEFAAALAHLDGVRTAAAPPPSESERFAATFESACCLVRLGRIGAGVARYETLFADFATRMSRDRPYRTLIRLFDEVFAAANDEPLLLNDDVERLLLDLVERRFPDRRPDFERLLRGQRDLVEARRMARFFGDTFVGSEECGYCATREWFLTDEGKARFAYRIVAPLEERGGLTASARAEIEMVVESFFTQLRSPTETDAFAAACGEARTRRGGGEVDATDVRSARDQMFR